MELAAVAERLFLKHGFAETTMQMIAWRPKRSKETLYRHFASKEALFAELINARAVTVAGPQSALARDEPPETALLELGMSLMNLMMKGEAPSLFNIVLADARRAPDLAHIFYDQGPGATLKAADGLFAIGRAARTASLPKPSSSRKAVSGGGDLALSSALPDRAAAGASEFHRDERTRSGRC